MLIDKDGKPYKEGHNITNKKYAKTLEIIQKDPESFYTAKLAQMIAEDMDVIKGNVTLDDLKKYKTVERKPLESELSNMNMYLTPPPSSGAVLALILNILKGGYWLNIIACTQFLRIPVDLRLSKALFSLDPDNPQLHCFFRAGNIVLLFVLLSFHTQFCTVST